MVTLGASGDMTARIGVRIRELRSQKGISQQRLAELLDVSRPTISQMEHGERKISAEELDCLAKIFNISVDSLLKRDEEPKVILQKAMRDRRLQSGIRINVPQKSVEKFKEVLLYILNKVGSKPNVGETVIYKLLYFIDFDFYEKYEEQLVGATYIKNNYGPTPLEFQKVVEHMADRELVKVKSAYFSFPQTKYLPLRKPHLTKLRGNEIEVIDSVLNRLSDMNASQISKYSHDDVPWLTAEDGGIIEYESAFYRVAPYSVREYEEYE